TFWLGGIVPIAYWMLALLVLLDVTLIASPWLAGDADRIVVVWTTVDTPRQAIPYAIVGILFIPVLWYLVGLLVAVQAAVACGPCRARRTSAPCGRGAQPVRAGRVRHCAARQRRRPAHRLPAQGPRRRCRRVRRNAAQGRQRRRSHRPRCRTASA